MTEEHKQIIISAGQSIRKDFVIDEATEPIYQLLDEYFRGNTVAFENRGYSLKKGNLIIGTIGIGKTLAMNVFSKLTKKMRVIPARLIIRDFKKEGVKVIDDLGRNDYSVKYGSTDRTYRNICIDDLGLEDVVIDYGNKVNVIGEILLDRYDNYNNYGQITHATTNLTYQNLKDLYGDRVMDRIKEMFNVIEISGNSLRK